MNKLTAAALFATSLTALAACNSDAAEPRFKSCSVGAASGRCGTLSVAEDRSKPDGRRIDLNIVIVPAKAEQAKPDPLFFFHGGPGGAATSLAAALSYLPFRQDRDMIFVDQRGTGRSNSISCGEETLADTLPSLARFDLNRQLSCLETIDADTRHYSTREFIADIDEVRIALGAEKINIFGGSYGSRAAFAYIDSYPEHVRSVIMRGVAPTDFVLPRDFPKDSQAALDGMLKDCAADTSCNRRYPDLRGKIDATLKRLEEAPAKSEIRDPSSGKQIELSVDRELYAAAIHYALYSSNTVARLPRMLVAAEGGDFEPLLNSLVQFVSAMVGTLSDGLFLSVTCAEDLAFLSDDEIRRSAEETLIGSEFGLNLNETCRHWPHAKLDRAIKKQRRTETPILLINGQYDPVTPPHHTEKIMPLLPNAMHLVMPGESHANLFPGCVQRLASQFLDQGSVEGLSDDCVKKRGRPSFR